MVHRTIFLRSCSSARDKYYWKTRVDIRSNSYLRLEFFRIFSLQSCGSERKACISRAVHKNALTSMLFLDNINLKRRTKAKAILKLMIIKFILIFQQERN